MFLKRPPVQLQWALSRRLWLYVICHDKSQNIIFGLCNINTWWKRHTLHTLVRFVYTFVCHVTYKPTSPQGRQQYEFSYRGNLRNQSNLKAQLKSKVPAYFWKHPHKVCVLHRYWVSLYNLFWKRWITVTILKFLVPLFPAVKFHKTLQRGSISIPKQAVISDIWHDFWNMMKIPFLP